MSKQLAISAAFSVFAMSAFILFGTGEAVSMAGLQAADRNNETGAEAIASTPVLDQIPDVGPARLLPDFHS